MQWDEEGEVSSDAVIVCMSSNHAYNASNNYHAYMSQAFTCHKVFATLGPTWEFQLCLKSCNLASWTTKWHDYVPVDHPPTHPLDGLLVSHTYMVVRKLKFGGCLVDV